MAQSKTTLIYVGDPMCSWCYGFAPELTDLMNELEDKVEFELVLGGLRPYNTETMTDLKDFLTHHWEDVNKASGQEFSYEILNKADITYDTEPPSRATVVVRNMNPDLEIAFFKKIQTAFYKENKNMHLPESYKSTCEELGIDFDEFKSKFESERMKLAVKDDFLKAGEMGVRGFPSLVLQKDGQYILIANGFAKSEDLLKRLEGRI